MRRFVRSAWVVLALGLLATPASANIFGQEDQAKKDRYVKSVERLAGPLSDGDYQTFQDAIAKDATAISAQDLWNGGRKILAQFGKVKKIEFSEFDGDGAFIKVHFERATREVYVRLDEEGKFIELTYVPPGGHP